MVEITTSSFGFIVFLTGVFLGAFLDLLVGMEIREGK